MKYIVFPVEKLNEVSQELLDGLHLSPRRSVDGTEVIMKLVHYEMLFPAVMTLELDEEESQAPACSYPVYEGEELKELLSAPSWTAKETL